MNITLNNNQESYPEDNLNIQQIVDRKGFTFKMLVTKLNGKIVKKEERHTTLVHDGDELMVLHLMSGG